MKKLCAMAFALALTAVSLAPAAADEYTDALNRFMITELMYRYAIMHNSSNIQGYADLFTKDAVMYDGKMHYLFAKGRDQIVAAAESDRDKYNPEAKISASFTWASCAI